MIVFDETTGKFRDSKTGRLRSDVSGLLSSNARRQFKKFAKKKSLDKYRSDLGKKHYKKPTKIRVVKQPKQKVLKSKQNRNRFSQKAISNYEDYIDDWADDFDLFLEEDDIDLETP